MPLLAVLLLLDERDKDANAGVNLALDCTSLECPRGRSMKHLIISTNCSSIQYI
jgi:hypothetical protein